MLIFSHKNNGCKLSNSPGFLSKGFMKYWHCLAVLILLKFVFANLVLPQKLEIEPQFLDKLQVDYCKSDLKR